MTDEVKDLVDHGNDFQNDEDVEEVVTNSYIIHDPNARCYKMEPKLGDMFEPPAQLKFYVTNYVVNEGYQIYFQKSEIEELLQDVVRDMKIINSLLDFMQHGCTMTEPFRLKQ